MRIDMHVLENIDTNPKISIEKLSYELNVSREDVLASIRRLRSDRRRFQQVQHEVEKKRFHKVIEDGTKNIDNDDYSAEY
jgi:biotin operon repressor